MIFAGIGVLFQVILLQSHTIQDYRDSNHVCYQVAKDVDASQAILVDLFGRIENLFRRLESYTEVRPTVAMTDIIVKITVEILSILGIATKEIKQGRASELVPRVWLSLTHICLEKYVKKLLGKNEIEDSLKRLDTLTQEEARMATAEIMRVTQNVDDNVKVVLEGA